MRSLLMVVGSCSILLMTACASSTPPANCPVTPAAEASGGKDLNELDREQLARKLIEVTMGKNLGNQVLDSMVESLRKLPGLPEGFIDRFRANARIEDLHDIIVPIYVKTYDRETMIAAIAFYQSEQGKILIEKLPEATRLSMEAGQRWGQQVAEKTLQEMGITPQNTN
jgi:uncharacterized protein